MARHARRLILWTTGALLSLALLALLGIALLLWGIDPDVFRGRLERAATDALGRRVELTGTLRWRPGLNFQVESQGGRIANAAGFGSTPLATWRVLRLGVEVKPLLDRQLVIDRIELEGLRLDLARGAAGPNWELPAAATQASSPGLRLRIGSLTLRDGTVTFTDAAANRAWSATQLGVDVTLPARLDAPELRFTDLSLAVRLGGAPLQPEGIALRLRLPRLDVEPARKRVVAPDWELDWNDAAFSGAIEAQGGDAATASGSLRAQVPSLRRLLRSMGVDAPHTRDADALGRLDLKLAFSRRGAATEITGLDARLDATRLTGAVRLASLSPWSLRFDLAADEVNLDRYLTPRDEPGTPLRLPLAQLSALDAKGTLAIRNATLAGAAAREMRIDVD